ncbi:3607_t:CDS:10 [Entrophospora sp. SA101]|nr:3607_t:CDS:10 [Entrophospora sp. SA101]
MDSIKIAKVENVKLDKGQTNVVGTLHLTTYQLIFEFPENVEELLFIVYPIIHTVECRPPTNSEPKLWPLIIRCRNFVFFTLYLTFEQDAIDVFDTIQKLTCIKGSISQVYAFDYKPEKEFICNDGWSLYDPSKEFARMGLTRSWRFSHINKKYDFCPTYPHLLVFPSKISDTVLGYATRFRSKSRVPTLSYLHWSNKASITRSSQPMVGLKQNRSIQDEKLIEAIFQSNLPTSSNGRQIYGSTSTNLIVDARPTANAMANGVMGAGSENIENYKNCTKCYMGIDNIHVMRDSLGKLVEVIQSAEASGSPIKKQHLDRSNWLKHISSLLYAAVKIIKNVHVYNSHVLVHCSDGWDRTAQLTSISELSLDPYYRTFIGFQVLIEKEWVSFGHKFSDRSGHLSNEKFFINSVANSALNRFYYKQTHQREISPVFHQFLDCVYQLYKQFPTRFEFNEKFLIELHCHCYSCQFGTFLFNSEKERKDYNVAKKTYSVWDYFNSDREQFINPLYNRDFSGENGEKERFNGIDMGVLIPDIKNVVYWAGLFNKKDEELNGKSFDLSSRWKSNDLSTMITTRLFLNGNLKKEENNDNLVSSPINVDDDNNGGGKEIKNFARFTINNMKSVAARQGKDKGEGNAVKYNRRINTDEVEFLDDRLKDNSFLAKRGAIGSYGEKAHKDLIKVRGKNFRAQKTKKKKGSYRGGKIDKESHSIKFNFDD